MASSWLSHCVRKTEATHLVDDADLVCQAGARWEDINDALLAKEIPLFFPVRQMFWLGYPQCWLILLS